MRAQGVTRASDEPTRTQLESLVAVIAHELRTPLAIARTGLAMLAEIDAGGSAAPGTRGDLVAMVDRNVDLAILLTERMSFARAIGDHTVELAPIDLDLAALVRQSVDDLRVAFLAEHPVAIEGLGVLAVRGDPAALREIVFNLLVNAAKYSAAGAAITVTVGCAPPGAQIFVRDHGRDVAAGDAEHIFDEFAEPTRRPPASASGYSSPAASRALVGAISPSARARAVAASSCSSSHAREPATSRPGTPPGIWLRASRPTLAATRSRSSSIARLRSIVVKGQDLDHRGHPRSVHAGHGPARLHPVTGK